MRQPAFFAGAALAFLLLAPDGAAQQFRASGQEVVPAFEGWEQNPDGTFNLVFGTMNRNWEEELHVPIGPDNNIEPGGPDQGQPTWFLPRRNRFLFRIRVPADFGENEIVWTVTSPNGKTYRAYGTLHPDYFIDVAVFQRNYGLGVTDLQKPNLPPVLRVEGEATRTARVDIPVTLTAFASDDGWPEPRSRPPVNPSRPSNIILTTAAGLRLSWFVYRGGGEVVFDPPQIKVWEDTRPHSNSPWGPGWETPPLPADGEWSATATFTEPGTYVLRCLAHDGGLTAQRDITFHVN